MNLFKNVFVFLLSFLFVHLNTLQNVSPISVSPDSRVSPLLESLDEVDEGGEKDEGRVETKMSKVNPESLAEAYSQIFTPSPGQRNVYQPLQNLFSLEETEADGLSNGRHSAAKTVHFGMTPKLNIHTEHKKPKDGKETDKLTLSSYTQLDGDLYKQ